jgi:hypothetical protein
LATEYYSDRRHKMCGSTSDGPGNSESTDQARASTLGPKDYQKTNFGSGMQLNASGRTKMGIEDPNNDGGDNNGVGAGGSTSPLSKKGGYNPSGNSVTSQATNPDNVPKRDMITDFLSEGQSTEFRLGQRDTENLGDTDFLKSGSVGNALANALGGDKGFNTGVSPFSSQNRGAFLKGQGQGYGGEVPGEDATVEQQMGSATPGGEVGVGSQSFGARALGGSNQVVENMAPPGAEQTDTPVAQAQSDIQPDPNQPMIAPGSSVVPDVNYVLPTANQQQLVAFSPNDPRAVYTARGPLSRNLISERTGFGSRFI